MTLPASLLLAAVTIGTWNGEWFPSGRAEHRAAPEIEQGAVRAAGRMLRAGLAQAGASDLAAEALGDGRAVGVEASWSVWKRPRDWSDTPPRGYARARVVVSPAVTATVYAVHLKSNYGQTTEALADANRRKRALAVGQILEQERPRRGKAAPVVLAGDFNADRWGAGSNEVFFAALENAGYRNALALLPPGRRATYPGSGRFANLALDYVFLRGFAPAAPPWIVSGAGISDHDAVFVNLEP